MQMKTGTATVEPHAARTHAHVTFRMTLATYSRVQKDVANQELSCKG